MVGDARIYAANGNPRKRRPDSKPALFFFLPPSPLLSFRQPPKKKSANREMHSTYPAGTFPKLMRDEITAPSPRGSGRQSRRLLERHWRRCPFPPRPPCQLLFQPFLPLLFFFPLFLSFFFFFSSSWSFVSPPLIQCSSCTHEEGREIRFNSFGRSERAFTLYKKLPLIFDGTSSAPGVSKRNFPVIGGGYFSSL